MLERLEHEDAEERARGVPRELRARQVAPSTGRFLFSLVTLLETGDVLEIGGSRGYSTLWLAAAARPASAVVSLELDPGKCEAWRRNLAEAGLEAELVEGNAFDTLPKLDRRFALCFLDAEKEDYELLFAIAREKLEPGGLVVADNVLSHEEALGAYSRARQADPTLVSVTLPLDRGLELSTLAR